MFLLLSGIPFSTLRSSETTVKLPHLVTQFGKREIRQILVWKTPNNYLFAKQILQIKIGLVECPPSFRGPSFCLWSIMKERERVNAETFSRLMQRMQCVESSQVPQTTPRRSGLGNLTKCILLHFFQCKNKPNQSSSFTMHFSSSARMWSNLNAKPMQRRMKALRLIFLLHFHTEF